MVIASRDDAISHDLRLRLNFIDMDTERLFANSRTVIGFNSDGNNNTIFASRARLTGVA